MESLLPLFLTVLAIVFVPTSAFLNFKNPLALGKNIVKNEEGKSNLMVHNMDISRRLQMKNHFSSMLLRGQPVVNMGIPNEHQQTPFNWTSCGPANQLMEIKNLLLKPSPLQFPGTLTFGFDIVFHDNIEKSDNVKAVLELSIQSRGIWIKIPCFGGIGSCTYENLCTELEPLSCPESITKQVPCHCPFKKGEYKLQPYSVEVLAEVFIAGNYRATANLTSARKGPIGCYQIHFSVE